MNIWVLIYLVAVNVAAFCAFGIDKYKAKCGKWRTPEKTLMSLALLGGSLGAWLAMQVFRHKTQHRKFSIGIPAILIAQVIVASLLIIRLSQTPMPI